jgi:hypothetical protein
LMAPTWSTSSILVSGNVNGDDDFVVGFYGLTYVLILYQQWVSGNTYNVYILRCTVSAPLSCGSPVSINPPGENAVDAQELTLTYNPSPGRWYAGYVYNSAGVGGYEYITFTSTDGSTWSSAEWSWPGSSVPSQAFRFHVTAIPGTSNAFAFTAARYDESYYRYCIVIVGSQSCSTMPYTIGSKTANTLAPPIRGIPSTSSGRAEIFTNNQWFRCTSSSCTAGTVGSATWNDPVSLMRDSSSIYMFYMSGNLVKRRTVTSSVGSEVTYLVAPSGQSRYGVGVPVEATTPRPVAYLAGSSLYVHKEPTSFTVTIPQTLTASDTVNRAWSRLHPDNSRDTDRIRHRRQADKLCDKCDGAGRVKRLLRRQPRPHPARAGHGIRHPVLPACLTGRGGWSRWRTRRPLAAHQPAHG